MCYLTGDCQLGLLVAGKRASIKILGLQEDSVYATAYKDQKTEQSRSGPIYIQVKHERNIKATVDNTLTFYHKNI